MFEDLRRAKDIGGLRLSVSEVDECGSGRGRF